MKTKLLACLLPLLLWATAARTQQPAPAKPGAYRIQVTLRQTGAAKPRTLQTFVFTLRPGGNDQVSSGDRVPVATAVGTSSSKIGAITYVPVGTDIHCQLPVKADATVGQLEINLTVSLGAVVAGGSLLQPVFRHGLATVATAVPLGHAITVAEFPTSEETVPATGPRAAKPQTEVASPSAQSMYQVEVFAAPAFGN